MSVEKVDGWTNKYGGVFQTQLEACEDEAARDYDVLCRAFAALFPQDKLLCLDDVTDMTASHPELIKQMGQAAERLVMVRNGQR